MNCMFAYTSPTSWVEIDLGAIVHNIAMIRKVLRPQTRLMLVLKADAYGHGIVEVATTAASCGVDAFAVVTLEEGIKIRKAGIKHTILLLNPMELSTLYCEMLLTEHLEPTISTEEEVRFLQDFCTARNVVLPVHLKIDTGMSRLGIRWAEAVALALAISQSSHLCLASVYSHLAGYDITDRQTERFCQTLDAIHAEGINIPITHLVNSALTFCRPDLHFDQVRIGLALYGALPSNDERVAESLRPVMSLKAKIVHIKPIPQGEGIGYCPQFVTAHETKIGILGIGYANGIPRILSGKMNAIVSGKLVPQLGLITMNHLMIDLSSVPHATVGDSVSLLGSEGNIQIGINELAKAANTIAWEMLCLFGNSNQKTFH